MKKVLAVILSIALLLSFPISAYALNDNYYYSSIVQGDGSSSTMRYQAVFRDAEISTETAEFTLEGFAGSWILVNNAYGTPLYVNNTEAGRPIKTTASTFAITKNNVRQTARDYDSFTLYSNNSYLYFHDNSNAEGTASGVSTNYWTFNRQSSAGIAQTNFSIFVRDKNNFSSGIYGYRRITSESELVAGQKYLIAHPGNYSADNPYWFVMFPSTEQNCGKYSARVSNHFSEVGTPTPSKYNNPMKPADGKTASQPYISNTTGGSAKFRIPGMVTMDDGSIVTLADARWNTTADGGGNDTIVSRSSDDGTTWNYTFANYLSDNMSSNTFATTSSGYCDSELATDGKNLYMLSTLFPGGKALNSTEARVETGAIYTGDGHLYLTTYSTADTTQRFNFCVGDYVDGFAHVYTVRNNKLDTPAFGSYSWNSTAYTYSDTLIDEEGYVYGLHNGSYQCLTNIFYKISPFKVRQTTFLSLKKSTDGGKTWSKPTLLNVKRDTESFYGIGPGRGATSEDGSVIFFSAYNGGDGGFSSSAQRTSVVYSTDGGESWKRSGNLANFQTSESQLVVLNEDEIGITLRCFFRSPATTVQYRDAFYSKETESLEWIGSVVSTAMTKTGDCQISAIKYSEKINGKNVILVSTPTNSGSRANGKIYAMYVNDDYSFSGYTPFAVNSSTYMYSCLTELSDGTVALLYESSDGAIQFSKYDIHTIDTTFNPAEDESALEAAVAYADTFSSADYTSESFATFQSKREEARATLNAGYSQKYVDYMVNSVFEAVRSLVPNFKVTISGDNGFVAASYDKYVRTAGTYSIPYGTAITLSAAGANGYNFIGWYDTFDHRFVSREPGCRYVVSKNVELKAVFVKNNSATLTFANESGWIASIVSNTVEDWLAIESLDDYIPEVPYSYGHTNGRWVIDDNTLAKLQSGQSVTVYAEYDGVADLPDSITSTDGTPVLDLQFSYDDANAVGSFIMTPAIPSDIKVNSIGVAFKYAHYMSFDPTDNFELLLNNKTVVSSFATDTIDEHYIVNFSKFDSRYSFAARGYVTYTDTDGTVKTVYSNQVNVISNEWVK